MEQGVSRGGAVGMGAVSSFGSYQVSLQAAEQALQVAIEEHQRALAAAMAGSVLMLPNDLN